MPGEKSVESEDLFCFAPMFLYKCTHRTDGFTHSSLHFPNFEPVLHRGGRGYTGTALLAARTHDADDRRRR